MIKPATRIGAVLLFMIVAPHLAGAQSASAALKKEIAPTGVLRAAINHNNPALARLDIATGQLHGLAVDLARELGNRIDVQVQLIPYESAGRVAAAAKSGEWDIGFLAVDPLRANDIDFTSAYLEIEGTYLVPADSPLKTIQDVDREGVKIAVSANSAYDLFLTRQLKRAQLIRAENPPQAIEMMIEQNLDALAAVRTALVAASPSIPGSRVLSGHFMTIPQAAALPKGRPAAVRYVRAFIEEMKATNAIAAGLKRHGLGPDDAKVAPLAEK